MLISRLLTQDRVGIRADANHALDKAHALRELAGMLSRGTKLEASEIERILREREDLQSTGIGEGVAIPHGAIPTLSEQFAALLIVPEGVEFASLDHSRVTILFALVGPKHATGEHLRTLARVSRLLRDRSFRERLIASPTAHEAWQLVEAQEAAELGPRDPSQTPS